MVIGKRNMGLKVKKEKRTDYTFISDSLRLGNTNEKNESESRQEDNNKPDYRLRDDAKISRVRNKSKVTGGGHSKQSHSPVYE